MTFDEAVAEAAVVAIIRGVKPEEAEAITGSLYDGGVRLVEVPLNSPEPLDSIRRMAAAFGQRMVVGAGTVLTPDDVAAVAEAGARFVVSPDTDTEVIAATLEAGLESMPGWGTASEALAACAAGARRLKLFPAATYGPGHVKQVRAVLPREAEVWAVGGVGAADVGAWLQAGVRGFGVGSELYVPGQTAEVTREKAWAFVGALQSV